MILLISFVASDYTYDSDLSSSFTGLQYASQAWGDYDNDGNLDLAICGQTGTTADTARTIIYKIVSNGSGTFVTEKDFGIVNVTECSINWADINKDGWNDLIVAGKRPVINTSGIQEIRSQISYSYEPTLFVYTSNHGNNFTNSQNLTGITLASTVLGDYDNDEDLDMVAIGCKNFSGQNCNERKSQLYIYSGMQFYAATGQSENLTNVYKGSLALGDYDNDGDLDLALSGTTTNVSSGAITHIYINNNSIFRVDENNILEGVYWGNLAWADYDNDSDIDLFVAGRNSSGARITKIFDNDASVITENTKPGPTTTWLKTDYNHSTLTMSWYYGTDSETYKKGIYYNLRAGSNSSSMNDIISGVFGGSSNPTQGYFGNMINRRFYNLSIPDKCVYWQVQSIDTGFMKSEWSAMQSRGSIEVCDNYDNDCDREWNGTDYNTTIDEGFDQDGDFFFPYNGTLNDTVYNCTNRGSDEYAYDCNDSNAAIYPGVNCFERSSYTGDEWRWNSETLECDCTGGSLTLSNIVPVERSSGGGGIFTKPDVKEETKPIEEPPEEEPEEEPTEQPSPPEESSSSVSQSEKQLIQRVIFENKVQHNRKVEYHNDRTQITDSIKNVGLFVEEEIKLRLDLPKSVVEYADLIFSNEEFTIIEQDPVIEYDFGDLQPGDYKEIIYSVPGSIDEDELELIDTIITKKDKSDDKLKEEREDLEEKLEKTKEAVDITTKIEVDYEKNETIFNIDFEIDDNVTRLENVSIIMEIPKCMMEYLKEIDVRDSNLKYDIQNADPIIVWHIENLIGKEKIRFALKAVADEECTNQAKVLAVARDILFLEHKVDYRYVTGAAIFAFLIFSVLLFFSKFTEEVEHEDKETSILIKAVRRLFHRGYNEEQIRKELRRQGHPIKYIDEVLKLNAKGGIHYWILRLGVTGEELIFLCIGILHTLNFVGMIPGDLDFVKKIISWTLMALIFYHVSVTRVLFGFKWTIRPFRFLWGRLKEFKIRADFLVLIAYFGMLIKEIISFARVSAEPEALVYDLYNFLINNAIVIERTGFFLGAAIIFILSFVAALKKEVEKPSFVSIFGIIGKPIHIRSFFIRLISFNLFFLFFYYMIFEKVTEWLAIAIDAPLFILSIPFAIYFVIKHGHKVMNNGKETIKQMTAEVATFLDKYYENFINLFHYRKTVILGMIGILLLHILTEVLVFIIPYITSRYDPIYFGNFNENHSPIFFAKSLVGKTLSAIQADVWTIITVYYTYIMNVIGFIAFAFLLGYLWYWLARNKDRPFNHFSDIVSENKIIKTLPYLIPAMFVFIFNGCFNMVRLVGDNIIGVDIQTKAISLDLLFPVVIGSVLAFTVSYFMIHVAKKITTRLAFSAPVIFFIYYIQIYYRGIYSYFGLALGTDNMLLNIYFGIFSAFSMVFYIAGSLAFLILALGAIWNIRLGLFEEIFHLNMHIIHHHETHEEHVHGEKVDALVENILSNMAHGHELFIVAEQLIHHGWDSQLVHEAVIKAEKDPRWEYAESKIKHKVHPHKVLKKLHKWIKGEMKLYVDVDKIIEKAKKIGYYEDDIVLAFRHINLKGRYKELKNEEVIEEEEEGFNLEDEINEIVDEYRERGISKPSAVILLKHAGFGVNEIRDIVRKL